MLLDVIYAKREPTRDPLCQPTARATADRRLPTPGRQSDMGVHP